MESKYLFEGLEFGTYTKWKAKLKAEIDDLLCIEADSTEITKATLKQVDQSWPLLANLDSYFEQGSASFKKNLLGSITTGEMVVMEKRLDRTNFHPIILYLGNGKTQKKPDFSGSSCKNNVVAGTGLEPVTFGL